MLVTCSEPELACGCSENSGTLADIALGLKGANFTVLDKIAKQGGASDWVSVPKNNAPHAELGYFAPALRPLPFPGLVDGVARDSAPPVPPPPDMLPGDA